MTNLGLYRFSIPSLPKEWFAKLEEVRTHLSLTQRQAIILALQCLCEQGARDQELLVQWSNQVREKHPARS